MARGSDFLQLDASAVPRGGRTEWLAAALRAAVAAGVLPVGSRLPPTRALSAELGVARGTVVEAYQRLTEEGLLTAARGAGTAVAARPVRAPAAAPSGTWEPPVFAADVVDLATGVPDLAAFPRAAWLRAEREVLSTATARSLGYAPPQGTPELRAELSAWLARSRGVRAAPGQIVVTAGVTGALSILAQVLRARGMGDIACEDPGADGNRAILDHWTGGSTVPVPVDGDGVDPAALAATDARAVLVTPAHQFPTGVVLSAPRRRALLAWARAREGLVIEDDYDAEYRYDRSPVGALHGLDPHLVAHTSSLSKTLAPALRAGWLVPPPHLLEDVVRARWAADLGSPSLPQLALALLLRDGTLARHLRTMRARHRVRRDAAVAAVREHLPGRPILGVAAGLHLLVLLPEGVDDREAVARAEHAGVAVQPLSRHRTAPGPPGLVIAYAGHGPARLRGAIARLGAAVRR
ncbi:GntR family transcriptional regulator / MocR family aminotransferase [Nocardiopsis flavescens]|uniref:GntR family transcriptional regulator / MocR family aminotransferase n=1 Tax=Nocardiopsis flavescens TaxID=758803 RepID=A0A1M6WCD2_9ACTN|nr:PLP-dependent aminotransferase family protein [Nocardiopsis flavescens]SHK91308.1 GntR family transcriptional regulator / MocR family aminotransferase [Nocardiopsis flavescens]